MELNHRTRGGQRYFSMKQERLMKKMIVGFGIVVAFVTPSFAQSYIASYGTGKLIDTPLLEKTNGAYGYNGTVPPRTGGTSSATRLRAGNLAYAYSPPNSHPHKKHSKPP
jgi:hypothetical protein